MLRGLSPSRSQGTVEADEVQFPGAPASLESRAAENIAPAYLELYNLEEDAGERKSVAEDHAEDHAEICRELTGIMNETYTPHPDFPLSESEHKVFDIRAWDDIAGVFSD